MIHTLEPNHEHVESITTLRSGKVIDKSIPPKESESMGESPMVNDEERVGEEEREIERIGSEEKESEKNFLEREVKESVERVRESEREREIFFFLRIEREKLKRLRL